MSKTKPIVLPPGRARFVHLHEPDNYEGDRPKYKIDVIYSPDDPKVQKVIEQWEAFRDEAYEEALANAKNAKAKKKLEKMSQKPVFLMEEDRDGEETGNIVIRAHCNATYERNGRVVSLKPKLVDAKRQTIGDDVFIGGGSLVKVAVTPFPYQTALEGGIYGCSYRLVAVQVLELAGAGNAADLFDEEDGFTVEDEDDSDDVPFDTDDDEDDEDF